MPAMIEYDRWYFLDCHSSREDALDDVKRRRKSDEP